MNQPKSAEPLTPSASFLQTIEQLQTASMLVYYPTEHIYWLGEHKVLPWIQNPARWSRISCRAWAMWIVLDLAVVLYQLDPLWKQAKARKEVGFRRGCMSIIRSHFPSPLNSPLVRVIPLDSLRVRSNKRRTRKHQTLAMIMMMRKKKKRHCGANSRTCPYDSWRWSRIYHWLSTGRSNRIPCLTCGWVYLVSSPPWPGVP